jgi:hypothetical protein
MGKEESKEFNKRSQEVSGPNPRKISRKADFAPSPALATSAKDAKAKRGPRMDTNAREGEKDEPQMDADIRRLATPRCGAFYRIARPSRAA